MWLQLSRVRFPSVTPLESLESFEDDLRTAIVSRPLRKLMLFVQEYVDEESLEKIVTALAVRWSLKDNISDPLRRINSTKKKIAYSFFKEYARTLKGVAGEELMEDEWAVRQMEKFGFFNE